MSKVVARKAADVLHKVAVTGIAGFSLYLLVNTAFLWSDAKKTLRANYVRSSARFKPRQARNLELNFPHFRATSFVRRANKNFLTPYYYSHLFLGKSTRRETGQIARRIWNSLERHWRVDVGASRLDLGEINSENR